MDGHAFESRTNFFFIFQLKNISPSNFKFSTSYGRSTDLKSLFGLLFASFKWLGEKHLLKYLLSGGEDVCPPLSKRCRHRLCQDWLKSKIDLFGCQRVKVIKFLSHLSSESILKLNPDFLVRSSLTSMSLIIGVHQTVNLEFFRAHFFNVFNGTLSLKRVL